MTGILVLSAVAVWIWLAKRVALRATSSISSATARPAAAIVTFLFISLIPVADEIVGAIQFRGLCEAAKVIINPEKARHRTLRTDFPGVRSAVEGQWMRTFHTRYTYSDVNSSETIATVDEFYTEGGVLSRFIGANHPLFVESQRCSPGSNASIAKKYGFNLL